MRTTARLLVPILLAFANPARAQHLIPGPGEPGYDTALAAKADAYDRQMHAFATVPLGWGLEVYIHDPARRALVDAFIASGATDFRAQSGMHPYAIIDSYGEQGDLGMFGGVGAAGDAFRYVVLRDSGAPAADVDLARQHLRSALDGLHWYTAVTGRPGTTARGLWRITPAPGDPPLPPPIVTTVPIGNPPHGTDMWHSDQSGQYPFLVWLDNTSHDQFDGYIMALGAAYDAIAGDSSFDPALVTRLQEDARAIAHSLMTPHMVDATNSLDLVLIDADGLPTSFPDLNPRMLGTAVFSQPLNGWNAWMALGVMRTLYAIAGDDDIGRYYYEELVGRRRYFSIAESNVGAMYTGVSTNFSNVNMAFVAAFGLLRYETDPTLAVLARRIFQMRLYAPGVDRQAKGCRQSLFDLMAAGFRPGGVSDADGTSALSDGLGTLRAFPAPPSWDVAVTNCDAAEIAALMCTASDGTPLTLASTMGHGGGIVATLPLPVSLRPNSNFEWRSDPYSVNGSGSDRLNPGMDWQGAYWMGRLLEPSSDGMASISSHARAALPIPAGADAGQGFDGGSADADAGPSSHVNGGCGCAVPGEPMIRWRAAWFAMLLATVAARRRRSHGAPASHGGARRKAGARRNSSNE